MLVARVTVARATAELETVMPPPSPLAVLPDMVKLEMLSRVTACPGWG
jgi:hypothetical protein